MNHGGKRPGAGRKPRATPLKSITVRLDGELVDSFRAYCVDRQVSQAKQVAKWIESEAKERGFFSAKCPACGWRGSSEDCEGGKEQANTGDTEPAWCPECYQYGDESEVEEIIEANA